MTSVYLIGSLRNPAIPELGNVLRAQGFDAFCDWYSAGFEADDQWQKYENYRGRSYKEALQGHAAKHVFAFDKFHLDRCDAAVLVMPAGRSGHMELGYFAGTGKPGYVLFDKEPERYDVMYQFAKDVFFDKESLILALKKL
jgi:nucleoside 2-deoxyribosyltransferase